MMYKRSFIRNVATIVAVVTVAVGAVIVGTAPAIRAQSPLAATGSASAATRRFEAVSVKPCKIQDTTDRGGKGGGGGGGGGRIRWDPGRLHEECQTLFNLIRDSYLAYPDGKPWRVAAMGR